MAVLTATTETSRKKTYTLISANHSITNAYTILGSAQIPTDNAKFAVLEMAVTNGTSTAITLQWQGGITSAGAYTTGATNKEVATDLTTRSNAIQAIAAGNPDKYYDFNLLRTPDYIEFSIKATNIGNGVVTRAILHLIFDD